jgi:hypothetical protein
MMAFLAHFVVSWNDDEYTSDRIMLSLSLVFGLILLNPWVDTFASSTGYTFMASTLPEWAWGTLLVGIALVRLWTITEQHLEGRRNVALVSMGIWIFISWGFFINNPSGIWALYSLMAYHNFCIFWRGRRGRWTSAR